MNKKRKLLIGCIITLFALAAAAYASGVYYFSRHFLPGTYINGIQASFKTVEELSARIKEQAQIYVIAIDERDHGREKLTAREIGMSYYPDNTLQLYLDGQEKWLWFQSFQKDWKVERSACIEIDQEKLGQALDGLRCMQPENVTPPSNAGWTAGEEALEIVPEVTGNQLNRERTLEVLEEAIRQGKEAVNLEEEDCYNKPTVTVDDPDFQKAVEQVTKLTDTILTYDFGKEAQHVDRSLITNWLIQDEQGNYIPDPAQVAAYVAELAAKYDTRGEEFSFITYDGREKTISGGTYGWTIDQEKETEALIENIMHGDIAVREPVYLTRGVDRKSGSIGKTYLEIDLTAQRMVLYKDGYLAADTPIVSGYTLENPTPVGCYAIGEKQSPKYLEDEFRNVSFWIPFYENLGIHDASWRTEFGADLYTIIGSAGGIDTPFEAARILYDNLETGDPVVIYQ